MITILLLGFLFGAALQIAKLNRFDTISGMAMLTNFKVAKAIALAIGIGAILINIEIGLGFASYHIKPILLGGIVVGGLIFGAGMAILGYCPGTMAISIGEGSLDAVAGLVGGLIGGLVYSLVVPSVTLILGPDLGSVSLFTLTGSSVGLFYSLLIIFGFLFAGIAFYINKLEKSEDKSWIYSGIALALLNGVVFWKTGMDRQIGASTAFPYLADLLSGNTANDYYVKSVKPGSWEVVFLTGALLAGLVLSLIKKEFKVQVIHSNWSRYKNNSTTSRILWAVFAGFILIFGARMAGGCTSGHVISGGMQLAVSSMMFAVFVFAGLLITGKLFYKKH